MTLTRRFPSFLFPLGLAALLLVVLPACDSEDPDDEPIAGEEEVFSNVKITLTPVGGGTTITADAVFDENGENGQIPNIALMAGTAYNAVMEFSNRFEDDPLELNEEITEEEDVAHQIYLIPEGATAGALTISDRNVDSEGLPLGSEFTLTVAANGNGTGTLRLVLRHYEGNEDEVSGQKAGDLVPTATEVPGVVENDLNFTYPVTIQ
ncbi:MAG: hypothetical protein AAFP18_01400 [Bacteroidota bacterium]